MEAITQWVGKSRFGKVYNVLQHIISKRILDKREGIGGNLADELGFLVTRCVIDTTLQDAAAVTMSADNNAVGADSVEDELSILET